MKCVFRLGMKTADRMRSLSSQVSAVLCDRPDSTAPTGLSSSSPDGGALKWNERHVGVSPITGVIFAADLKKLES